MLSINIRPEPRWLPVPGFEGVYDVSDAGEIRSVASGLIRRLFVRSNGYRAIYLTSGSKRKCVLVHAVVLAAFGGPRQPGQVCRHLDGNPANNTPSNLAWGTPSENANDCRLHGRTPTGERNPKAKLNAVQVKEIRASSRNAAALAKQYGVAADTINNVRKGITWTSI